MVNGRTCLHVVVNGTMTGQRYIDEVLLPHVRLRAVGDKFVFVDDNATCHRTLAVQDCLDSEVAGRNYPPTNKNTLIRALTEERDKLPQQLLDNVVQSLALNRRFLLGVWTVNSPQSHIVRVYDAGHGKSGVFPSAEWHDGDWLSDGVREAWLWFFIWVESF
ncbi:hypothetical protein TNCV_3237091 [Trichonephila clavipes]|nr:hypothetical protein TNCV_3237091 [Trichonephila clavipes]